eukprot:scaffold116410_cov35-Tisochrysis_lutea.AAC.3
MPMPQHLCLFGHSTAMVRGRQRSTPDATCTLPGRLLLGLFAKPKVKPSRTASAQSFVHASGSCNSPRTSLKVSTLRVTRLEGRSSLQCGMHETWDSTECIPICTLEPRAINGAPLRIRAALVDKDKHPFWNPPTIDGVSEAAVNEYFVPLGERELEF